MIEINLVPDVKQELIKAQRQRTTVISVAIIVALASVGAVVLLGMYVFAVQWARQAISDGQIKDRFEQLQQVPDLDKALSLQNQVSGVSASHDNVAVLSRFVEVRNNITPRGGTVKITKFVVDRANKTITIDGEAAKGFNTLDAFKKTIRASSFQYKATAESTELTTMPLTEAITDGSRSLTEDKNGKRVLRFSISFEYPEELFSRNSLNWRMLSVKQGNVTDSANDVPSNVLRNGEGE